MEVAWRLPGAPPSLLLCRTVYTSSQAPAGGGAHVGRASGRRMVQDQATGTGKLRVCFPVKELLWKSYTVAPFVLFLCFLF